MKKTITYLLLLFMAVTNAQSWETVGVPMFTPGTAEYSSIKLDGSGTPYVAYKDNSNGGKATVMKFNGFSWEYAGMPGFSAGEVEYVSFAINSYGTPYISYSDTSNGGRATVMKFNGTSWEDVGTPGFTANSAFFPVIATGSSVNPYIAYMDIASGGKATVMKFNGFYWEDVGTPGFSQGFPYFINLVINDSGTPYIAYRDVSNENKATVMKFNGSDWENIGSPGFSAGEVNYLSLVVDYSGTPYVAYQDVSNAGKATVMKFNGSAWESVGTPGFSTGEAYFTSVVINWYGNPCIAYSDGNNGYKAMVMQFTEGAWENVGAPAFSNGVAIDTSLVLDAQSNPYVAFRGENSKLTVMKFAPPCETPAPEMDSMLELCNDSTFRDLDVNGHEYNWYATVDATTALGKDELIAAGTYYVSQNENSCEGPRVPVDIVTIDCPGKTQLEAASCDVLLPQIDTRIYATAVPSAIGYIFSISDGTTDQMIYTQNRYIRLTDLDMYAYDTNYTITVISVIDFFHLSHVGKACTVTTPEQNTTLTDASCNSTVASFGTNIYANSRSFAQGYRFRISDGENVQTIDTPNTYFRLNQLASYNYNTEYTVRVAVMIDGEYGNYGRACAITTPAVPVTQLNAASCGTTVSRFSTNLYAAPVNLAEGYRFKVTNGGNVQTIEGTASYFRLSQLTSYQYNTAYTVEVAVKTNGAYGSYGQACTVTTPAPITQLRAQDCGITVAGFGTNLYADEVILAESYRFRVTHGATTDIVDRPNRNFRIKMLPSYTYNTTYSIEVAVMVNGVYGPYGAACNVFTPASGMRQNVANDEEAVRELTAFPNPYETSFTLSLETESDEPVAIQAYDIAGKMLDNRTVSPEELSDLRIGENYAAGIYSVIISQGSYTKVVKMVKK